MEIDAAGKICTRRGFPQPLGNSPEDSAFSQFPDARRRTKRRPISMAAIHLKTPAFLFEAWGAQLSATTSSAGTTTSATIQV